MYFLGLCTAATFEPSKCGGSIVGISIEWNCHQTQEFVAGIFVGIISPHREKIKKYLKLPTTRIVVSYSQKTPHFFLKLPAVANNLPASKTNAQKHLLTLLLKRIA